MRRGRHRMRPWAVAAHTAQDARRRSCARVRPTNVSFRVYGFVLRFTQCVCEVRPCVALWRVEKYAYADIIGRAVRAF
jgi:hypothetical protein